MIDKNTIGNGTDMSSGNFEDKLDVLERISSIIRGFIPENDEVERHKNFIENNIKFLDKINTADLEKLQTSERLFARMAEFSETINGNFEGLADALNEKIAPLLEKISGSAEKLKDVGINETKTKTNISIDNFKTQPTQQVQQIQQTQPTQIQPQQNSNEQFNLLISKMDELLYLLRSGQYSTARI